MDHTDRHIGNGFPEGRIRNCPGCACALPAMLLRCMEFGRHAPRPGPRRVRSGRRPSAGRSG
eukprot:5842985-Lingulodinium_polyedra.AAC.1